MDFRFAIAQIVLCGLIALLDGNDTLIIGYAALSLVSQVRVEPITFGMVVALR